MEIEDYKNKRLDALNEAKEQERIIRFIKMMYEDIATELDNERVERHAHSRKKLKLIKEKWTEKYTSEEDQEAIQGAIWYLDDHIQKMYQDSYSEFISWLKKECS